MSFSAAGVETKLTVGFKFSVLWWEAADRGVPLLEAVRGGEELEEGDGDARLGLEMGAVGEVVGQEVKVTFVAVGVV